MTPKAYSKFIESKQLEVVEKLKSKVGEDCEVEFVADHNIYINMMDGWSADKCDDTAYIIDEVLYKKLTEPFTMSLPPLSENT